MPPATTKTSATSGRDSSKGRFRPLPDRLRRDGFDYRQIHREGDFAIYRQTWEGNEHSPGLEVIRIRRRDGFQIGEKLIQPYEIYPNSDGWGTDGFTVTDR